MICVSTYGDSRDSKMEVEDTEYVIDELKKSEESLRSHNRSKVSAMKRRKVGEPRMKESRLTLWLGTFFVPLTFDRKKKKF